MKISFIDFFLIFFNFKKKKKKKNLGSYLELSKNKFGSNVVEKCVQFSGDNDRDMIIEEIVGTEQDWYIYFFFIFHFFFFRLSLRF